MELFDSSLISDILQSVASFVVPFTITFACAEFILQWFLRLAFGRTSHISID